MLLGAGGCSASLLLASVSPPLPCARAAPLPAASAALDDPPQPLSPEPHASARLFGTWPTPLPLSAMPMSDRKSPC
jgi:hypothetical protein